MIKPGPRAHLRVVEPPAEECPPSKRFELPPVRELASRIARAAVITLVVMMACAYLLAGAQIVMFLYRNPHDPWHGLGAALLFAFLLAVGLKVRQALRYRPVGGGEIVVEHHVVHDHYHHQEEGGRQR